MSHQPFETWLLSEEPLSPEQAGALREHLTTCESCQQLSTAWSEVQHLIRQAPVVEPASGFTARWQVRLAETRLVEQRKRQRRQSWWALLASLGVAILLFGLLVAQILTVYDSPTDLLLMEASRLMGLLSTVRAIQEILTVLWGVLLSTVPPGWWAGLAAALGLLSLLWILSLRQLMLPRRITL
jgi:anti-sigma factor RsiW